MTEYIIDTGIFFGQPEFGGRAWPGFGAIGDGRNGYGAHVGRVLSCGSRGPWSGIIAGFDWAGRNTQQPAVVNASLGGDRAQAVNDVATVLSDRGVLIG